jgi:hypothetical protein
MILNTIIPALQGKANKETHSHAQVFLCSDFFIIVANPPSGIEGKIIMGVFQKASWNKCKHYTKNYNIRSCHPQKGLKKNSNIENLAKISK